MRKTYLLAGLIAMGLSVWMLTGFLGAEEARPELSIAEQNLKRLGQGGSGEVTAVRVMDSVAIPKTRSVRIRGQSSAKRQVTIQTQLDGLIAERPVERGDWVEEGDLLCRISTEDRQARVIEAEAQLEQAKLLAESNQKLASQGLLSEAVLAESKARFKLAEANVLKRRIDRQRLQLVAPFKGVVEDVHAEVGQFVTPGMACATVVELDPILIRGALSESKLRGVTTGRAANATFENGAEVRGLVSFVSHVARPGTRTFEIEIEVENPDQQLVSGLSADIQIDLEQVLAHRVSPGLLLLDDEGRPGLRSVDDGDRVVFHAIQIIDEDESGIWVVGLPDSVQLITVGQHLVSNGERISKVFERDLMQPVNERG